MDAVGVESNWLTDSNWTGNDELNCIRYDAPNWIIKI